VLNYFPAVLYDYSVPVPGLKYMFARRALGIKFRGYVRDSRG